MKVLGEFSILVKIGSSGGSDILKALDFKQLVSNTLGISILALTLCAAQNVSVHVWLVSNSDFRHGTIRHAPTFTTRCQRGVVSFTDGSVQFHSLTCTPCGCVEPSVFNNIHINGTPSA